MWGSRIMRKFIVALTTALLVLVGVFATVPAKAFAAAPSKMWMVPTEANGIPATINLVKGQKQTGGNWWNPTYADLYELYLPGDVQLADCKLSWDGGVAMTVGGQSYSSDSCPIPSSLDTDTAYTYRDGNQNKTLYVKVHQGSPTPGVQVVFIEIDETQGTIANMKASKDNTCSGTIFINGQQYELTRMKGRGNASWTESKDKKPYNITLGKKINFPGVDSAKTKKWSLMAEVLDRSLLCNRSGFWTAHEMGIGQDTTSADVWMNGEYQGCYMITPKTDSFVTDDGFMIEQDNYLESAVADGGDPQFKLDGLDEASGWSSCYNRITVKKMGGNLLKKDGVVDESPENMELVAQGTIKPWLQDALNAILSDNGYNNRGKYYTDYIDVESFAKMYLMFEYVKSYDVCAGSILFYRDGMSDADKLKAGPLWDLDNAMGSTYRNSALGKADDRTNGDRRSGEGDFIANVTEYKTSIYKNLRKHSDFMEAVTFQYNKHKSAFDALESATSGMSQEIRASALMNHMKVEDLGNGTGKNNHYYRNETSLGSNPYKQTYVATTGWDNYVTNLLTYVRTRSLWFSNTYTDPNFVDPATCEHQYEENITVPATCTAAGSATYTCPICKDSYTESIPMIDHDYQNGVCTMCGEALLTTTFACGDGASVTVYKTGSFTDDDVLEENATTAHPRNKDTGRIECNGDSQVNFVVHVQPGYELVNVSAQGGYKNLKGSADTGVENGYRLTKVNGDITVTITTNAVPRIKRHSMLLSSEIGVQFEVELPDGFNAEGSYMDFALSDGRTSRVPFADRYQLDEARNSYWFTCYVNPLELADTITATYHYGDGKEATNTYSGISYINAVKRTYAGDENLIAVVNSLQDYGHYLQRSGWTDNKEHETIERISELGDDAINAAKDGTSGMRLQKDVRDSGLDVMFSLTLNAATVINVYAAPSGSVDKVTGADANGTREINGTTYAQYDTKPIPAGDLDKMYKVELTTSSGTATVRGCAMSYVDSVLNSSNFTNEQKRAVTALYNYCAAVEAYED